MRDTVDHATDTAAPGGSSARGTAGAASLREWPGIRYNKGSETGRLGTSPPESPTALPYTEPRALLRAFNFLDVTCN
ncbi:conserved hypothetical protein [Streptomyces sviceus ATCC 29083]|uniref:Uncharacterized protein n=1 Tax=Streptomyces sviceus (strain ATCC 29083 / DSM 924 / JCM 4929 / NBRC 13980 / NCIMB 11184 / NRRL 5439 / UC 5370) TaxID=463191 RepID=B5HVM8_STRX2|nr:conserved hypothetical protein [Streptomyces sviceus ATCC 29083]